MGVPNDCDEDQNLSWSNVTILECVTIVKGTLVTGKTFLGFIFFGFLPELL